RILRLSSGLPSLSRLSAVFRGQKCCAFVTSPWCAGPTRSASPSVPPRTIASNSGCVSVSIAAKVGRPIPWRTGGLTGLLLLVQPHEAGNFFAHELGTPLVALVVLLGCLGLRFRVAASLAQRRRRGLEVLLPLRKLLLELLLADAWRR